MSLVSKFCAPFIFSSLAVIGLRADPVTVVEAGVGANETVFIDSSGLGTNLHVYAGVLDLTVNNVAMNGFCIDPWHWSGSGPMAYQTEDLALAPKTTGMGNAAATQIEQLWAQYYTPAISNVNAAALQIEIWTIVDKAVTGGVGFKLDSVDNSSASVMSEITTMQNFLTSNPNAAKADLIAITGAAGQDYVIARVPDGGITVGLLGLGLMGLLAFRRKAVKR